MKYGLINKEYLQCSSEDISYLLFLEGKSINEISKIRGIDKNIIENHIIKGKIKYRYLSKSKNIYELLTYLLKAGKEDKKETIKNFDSSIISEFISFANENTDNLNYKYKQLIFWVSGELKLKELYGIMEKNLNCDDVGVRRMIVSAAGKIGDSSGAGLLISSLKDENPQVRLYAVKGLTKIKSKESLKAVEDMKNSEEKEYNIRAINDYLNIIAEE